MDDVFAETSIGTGSIFLSMAIIISNIGSKYIHLDYTEHQQELLSHQGLRVLYIYCMAFVGTRNVISALKITGLYYLFVHLFRLYTD